MRRIGKPFELVWRDMRGAGFWRAGCDTCRWRREYVSREYAEHGLRQHLEDRGSEAVECRAGVYSATWWARTGDWFRDHPEYFEDD